MTEGRKKGRGAGEGGSGDVTAESELQFGLIPNPYTLSLPGFEGPLDLLLNLIREHRLDIFNIPIAFVTEKFIEYLDLIKNLNLDVASEYLRMAATLAYIKSRMMLPVPQEDSEDDEKDPRAELVERLLRYQQYKEASKQLADMPQLGRDFFARASRELLEYPVEEAPLLEVSVFYLLKAFLGVQRKFKPEMAQEITPERVTIAQRIFELVDLLAEKSERPFSELLGDARTIKEIVITFISVLEMAKMKMIRVFQVEKDGEIYVKSMIEPAETETRKSEISSIEYR
jgi:segregation and condensation protein A